jgi:hypothetical protein
MAKASPSVDSPASSVSGEASKNSIYDPASRTDFLARLQTFKLMTYSSKPPDIDAVAAARCGWYNEGSLGNQFLNFRADIKCRWKGNSHLQDMFRRLDYAAPKY